jgi:hypothetical protein
MNFKKLAFWTTLLTTAAVPLATAQNPVILQGNYVSNVFGQSNFVLNPNAQTNVANVTASSATVTRSTTTPLVATSEFNITTSTSTGYADWATRTFDAGMKNQNCEARFSYRGFSVGSTSVQIRQGSNTVAQLTLTASTDPRIASINFPCGDLSAATTLRVQQATASLTGTNEIGGIYVGLATNMANVSQAEEAGSYIVSAASNCNWSTNSSTVTNFSADADCNTGTVTGSATTTAGKIPGATFNNLKPGKYMFIAHFTAIKAGTVNDSVGYRLGDGSNFSGLVFQYTNLAGTYYNGLTLVFTKEYTTVSSPTIQVQGFSSSPSNSADIYNASTTVGNQFQLIAYRFPTSSELVVTPERQNTWGAVEYRNSQQGLFAGTAEVTGYSSFNNATWNQPTLLKGKAAVTTTNSGNDLGFSIPNLPVGSYKLEISGYMLAQPGTTVDDVTVCTFRIAETDSSGTLRTTVAEQVNQAARPTASTNTTNAFLSFQGIYTNTSVATRNFRLEASKTVDTNASNNGSCRAQSSAAGNTDANIISFTITPLDQPSNSALYVQGPVKAAATGDAIATGYQGSIISNIGTAYTGQSQGVDKTGTGITLQPGYYFMMMTYNVGAVAPTKIACGFTTSVNGSPINDATGQPSVTQIIAAGNTSEAVQCKSSGYFKITTATTLYPTGKTFAPTSSSYSFSYEISGFMIN